MPNLDREELAQQYGWALSVLRSSHELWSLFKRAVRDEWLQPKFVAELRETKWFRRHSEAWRQDYLLKRSDPGEWRARREHLHAAIRDQAASMGAVISQAQMSRVLTNVQRFGWSEAEVRNALGNYVKFQNGRMFGEAALTGDQLRKTALANGYKLADPVLQSWARAIARGDKQLTDYQDFIRENTARSYKTFANELKAGADLADLASPWAEVMAREWEMNPNEITMFDPTLRKALTTIDPDTGQAMTLTDFQAKLRRSERYKSTNGARDLAMGRTRGVLQMMGISV